VTTKEEERMKKRGVKRRVRRPDKADPAVMAGLALMW
jgi:hypothetical protein